MFLCDELLWLMGGVSSLQDELAAPPLCMGGLGILPGADIRSYAYLASSLQTH